MDADVGGGMHLSCWWHFRLVVEKAEENNRGWAAGEGRIINVTY